MPPAERPVTNSTATRDDPALDPKRRLRAACNNCHQSKVRCTGGNPCARCADLQFTCEYSYSARIGKPKGSKSKRTLQQLQGQQLQQLQQTRPRAPSTQSHHHPSPPFSEPPQASSQPTQSAFVTAISPRENTFDSVLDSMLAGSINNQGERSVSPERGNNLGSFDGPETPEEATDFWMLDEFDAELDAAVDAVSDSFPLMGQPFGTAASLHPNSKDTDPYVFIVNAFCSFAVLTANHPTNVVGNDEPALAMNGIERPQPVFATKSPTNGETHVQAPDAPAVSVWGHMPTPFGTSPVRRPPDCACLQQLNKALLRLNQVERQHGSIQVDVLLIAAMPSLSSCNGTLGCACCLSDLRIVHINILILRTLLRWLFSPLSLGELSTTNVKTTRLRLGRFDLLGEEAVHTQNFLLSRVVCKYRIVVKAMTGRLERAAGGPTLGDDLAIVEEKKMDLEYFHHVVQGLVRRLDQFIRLYKQSQAKRSCTDSCGDGIVI